jgi:hypothetical protein
VAENNDKNQEMRIRKNRERGERSDKEVSLGEREKRTGRRTKIGTSTMRVTTKQGKVLFSCVILKRSF